MSACTHLCKIFDLLCIFIISVCWAQNTQVPSRWPYLSPITGHGSTPFTSWEMSACTHLCKIFELLCIFIISVCWAQKKCSSYKSSDFIAEDETAKEMPFGDCSFAESLCNYTQACTDIGAGNWTIIDGSAVCLGKKIDYDSFSILMSPLLRIDQNTSLTFRYFQEPPAKLSVLLITKADITQVLPEGDSPGSFSKLLFIGPSTLKIGFRARVVEGTGVPYKVTLSNVTLQVVSYTPTPNPVITMATSPPYSQPATDLSTPAELTHNPEAAEGSSGNNAAVVAGVIVPVIVVAAVFLLGVFIWRRRKQQLHCHPKEGVPRKDTRNMSPFVSGASSSETSSANGFENAANAKNKSTNGVLDTGNNHYDIPRNGQPTRHAANTESRPLPARASPSAGDDEDHNYNILEEYSTAAASQTATSVYSYAKGEEHSPSKSNCLDADYNRSGSAEARSRGRSEAGSDAVEDGYIYIASTDAVAGVRSQAAASRPTGWNGHPGQNSTADIVNSAYFTSLDCEDGYSVLSAGNKQIQAFNDQRSEGAEKEYDRLASNVHGDYDRIRRKDRDDVLGNDYNYVGGHTEGDYDETGLTDKKKIIGNDYDHLV